PTRPNGEYLILIKIERGDSGRRLAGRSETERPRDDAPSRAFVRAIYLTVSRAKSRLIAAPRPPRSGQSSGTKRKGGPARGARERLRSDAGPELSCSSPAVTDLEPCTRNSSERRRRLEIGS